MRGSDLNFSGWILHPYFSCDAVNVVTPDSSSYVSWSWHDCRLVLFIFFKFRPSADRVGHKLSSTKEINIFFNRSFQRRNLSFPGPQLGFFLIRAMNVIQNGDTSTGLKSCQTYLKLSLCTRNFTSYRVRFCLRFSLRFAIFSSCAHEFAYDLCFAKNFLLVPPRCSICWNWNHIAPEREKICGINAVMRKLWKYCLTIFCDRTLSLYTNKFCDLNFQKYFEWSARGEGLASWCEHFKISLLPGLNSTWKPYGKRV